MKKAFSLSLFLLLSGVTLQALEQDHQVGLKVGLTSIDNDDGWNLENGTFFTDFRFDVPYEVQPRIDFGYISIDEDDHGGVGSLIQLAINGIYDVDINSFYRTSLEPYVLGGLGYEYVSDSTPVFESHPFLQAGFGARYPLTDRVKLVSEFKALQIVGGDNEDNEFALMVGVDIPLFVEVIRGEIDKNSRAVPDLTPPTKTQTVAEYEAPQTEVVVQSSPAINSNDGDNDGVTDSLDNCPHTPPGDRVNEKGCTIVSSIIVPEEATYLEDTKVDVEKTVTHPVVSKSVVKRTKVRKMAKRQNLKVNFEPNSSHIKSSSKVIVKRFADFLKNNPSKSVTIEGYTDNSGQRAKNIALSKRRAEAVRSLLIKYGVSASRIKAIGKGDLNPIADNDTEYGRRLNRRIEAVIH